MKKNVIDISDLQKATTLFRSKFGTFLGKKLLKWVCIDKVNKVHANNCHLKGVAFTTALLKDPLINIRYEVHNKERLENLPEGAFITVSNHPVGSLDGIILIDIFTALRPDFRVMVNGVLSHIGAMSDSFIPVRPDSGNQGKNRPNVNGIRTSLAHLQEGHPMGFFPSGAISFYRKETKDIRDIDWTHSVIRLIRKANVPVYPVYFDFYNSRFFYWLGAISWKIRTLRIPAEVFNKRGKTVHVYIGSPIPAAEIQQITDEKELARFLYEKTYELKKITAPL
ncbi:MAG: lysophospholipid acyltransferase family protein [Tannerellaceae bacterium]|jgi:putative hemolysin|nr:lysophospholipid acyltransferase family protein [Tannerellaceae bacterium]